MRYFLFSAALGLGLFGVPALSQAPTPDGGQTTSLATAIANYTDLTQFAQLLVNYPDFLSVIVPPNATGPVTLLIPNNAAFAKAQNASGGVSVLDFGLDRLVTIFEYHVVVARLTSANFTAPAAANGLTVPTMLKTEQFNNRSAGADLTSLFGADATGQVIFFSRDPIQDRVAKRGAPMRLSIRQGLSSGGGNDLGASVSLRSGLASTVNLTAVDGSFDGGTFQVVDSILTAPQNCSTTIRTSATLGAGLASLDTALDNAGIWSTLDHARNVTCLAPTTQAFAAAGDPQNSLNASALAQALLFHTLPMPTYTNFMTDGQVIKSLSGELVKITMKNNDIFFNDAKVLAKNVL